MSKLDEILQYEAITTFTKKDIKDLFLELVGKDVGITQVPSWSGGVDASSAINEKLAELRQKIEEL